MATIGLHFGHDAGAALTDADGYRVIEAERRLGLRHVCGGNGDFPPAAAEWLAELRERAVSPVTRIAVADWYTPRCQVVPPALVELVNEDARWSAPGVTGLAEAVTRVIKPVDWPLAHGLGDITLMAVRHHYAHAALAYHTSGARRALVLALDGTGNYAECGMVCLGDGDRLTPVMSLTNRGGPRFGLVYEALSRRVHGSQFDTGKLLGLTATGEPDEALLPVLRAMLVPQSTRRAAPDLYEVLDEKKLTGTALRYADTWWEYDSVSGGYLDAGLADSSDDDVVHSFGSVFPDEIRSADGGTTLVGTSPEDRVCRDLAATLQHAVEDDLLQLVTGISRRFPGYATLCYAGGCALNITANTRLAESGRFSRVHVPTCCDDSGIALGAALAVADPADRPTLLGGSRWAPLAYAGPPLTGLEALEGDGTEPAARPAAAPAEPALSVRRAVDDEEFIERVAELLAERRCVAWLEGGLETGPRALGHRSLLVSAHWSGARRYVSETIKQREWFRPVAPICPQEVADQFFTGPLDHAETMLFAVRVRPDRARQLAEARHIDGTARLQTVTPGVQPLLYRLCHAVGARTGLPVLINTSANAGGRPLLNRLDEALELLTGTELDAVALPEHHLIVE
ncbi:carbamoyltransferase C-terminal domain-containing protein [Streptomyces collinus]|uniref:NodU family carbamoyl transferase n=1 Tax=Streptomyces collinus TaxID=42684 RepID=A0AA89Q8C9_STRCU|nr:carbamoyltransferase C-terminal domain-containing protein [Streptomyces collinus]MBB5816247.1 putative NodU family carbamoyl transferase [Streptomyces collinus]WMX69078.1 carbamoyltransferase C-terminal domain-containing protein [Streptomyces collinus]